MSSKPDPDPNPDPKLSPKPDPDPKKIISDPQHYIMVCDFEHLANFYRVSAPEGKCNPQTVSQRARYIISKSLQTENFCPRVAKYALIICLIIYPAMWLAENTVLDNL